MKISKTLIAILNARGFCVDELSTDCPLWGTTYQFSRGGERVGFSVTVDSGNSLDELTARLEEKRTDFEDYDAEFIDASSASFSIASLDEIISLISQWNHVRCSYA